RYFGILSVDGVTKDLSCSIEQVLNNLIDGDLSGRVMFSFSSASLPRFGGEVAKLKSAEGQSRTPYRVEEHQLRPIYKQMAEIEACEETGAFRAGVSVIIEGTHCEEVENKMKLIEAMIKGAWSGVKVTISSAAQAIRGWDRILLKRPYGTTTPVSGARLIGLIDVSGPLPGISGRSLTPEFILPVYESDSNDMIPLGHHLRKRKLTHQMHRIHKDEFTTHTLIVGNPGGGKTNSARHLVHELYRKGIPYLVITPTKTEWRQLASKVPTQRIFTLGDESTAPFRFNFFDVPEGVPIRTHIDNIITCFIASWPSEGILTEHISKVFRRVYANNGWDVLSNTRGCQILLTDLYKAMEEVLSELEYGSRLSQDFVGAMKARFESLVGDEILAVMFNTEQGLTIPDLLNHQTVLEIRGFTDEKTSFISSLILAGVSEYLDAQVTPNKQELRHLLVLEEAHHVLKRVTIQGLAEGHSSQQQAINTIIRLLREARGFGLGLMLIDQMPQDLAPAAVKLPGITIIHNLKTPQERAVVGGQANLNEKQLAYIGSLDVGEAVVHQGFSQHAVNIRIEHLQLGNSGSEWNDEAVSELMRPFYEKKNHLVLRNLPQIDSWEPDPVILRNLEKLTETKEFAQRREEYANSKGYLAKSLIERLLLRKYALVDSLETERYLSLFQNYISNMEDGSIEG
ncbi:MAG: ATP-binding protein, partial [Candidatus Thorarchaeota archaeon]